jgi:hypothetical protein
MIVTNKVSNAIKTFIVASLLGFLSPALIIAQEGHIDLDFGNQAFSATIKEAPLRAVIGEIKKEKEGIWFRIWLKESNVSLDERVSVHFKGLPILDGLKRILSRMNYSLVFDNNGTLLGVFLLGKPARARGRARRRAVAPRTRTPRRVPRQHLRRK